MNSLARGRLGLIVSLVIVVFCSFWPILENGFSDFDDGVYLTANPLIKDLRWPTLSQSLLSLHREQYKPVTYAAFALEYHWFDLAAPKYHFVSIVLHTLNTVLVFYLFLALGLSGLAAWAIALLFGIHPLRVESVAWIAEQKDLFYGFFFLTSALLYIFARKTESRAAYYGSLCCFFLSLMAKPMMLLGPVIFIAIDRVFFQRKILKSAVFVLPFFCVAASVLLVNHLALVWGERYRYYDFAHLDISVILSRVYFYLSKIFWPVKLSGLYPTGSEWGWGYLVGGLGVVSFFLVFGIVSRAWKSLVFGSVFFLSSVAVVLATAGTQFAVADRYVYIAGIGIFYMCVEMARRYLESKKTQVRYRRLVCILGCCFIGVMSIATFERCFSWRNGMTFWSDVLEQFPGDSYSHVILGYTYYHAGLNKEASDEMRAQLRLDPDNSGAVAGMGWCLLKEKKFDAARSHFKQALRLRPDDVEPYNGLSWEALQRGEGDPREALAWSRKAAQISPMCDTSWLYMGISYLQLKDYDMARYCFERAKKLNPDSIEPWVYLGEIEGRLGRLPEALKIFNDATHRFSGSAAVYLMVAQKLIALNRIDEARLALKKALELAPHSPYVNGIIVAFMQKFSA